MIHDNYDYGNDDYNDNYMMMVMISILDICQPRMNVNPGLMNWGGCHIFTRKPTGLLGDTPNKNQPGVTINPGLP